jgi:DNA-binding NarL/FixJ family response regulator
MGADPILDERHRTDPRPAPGGASPRSDLSPSELEVLQDAANGLTVPESASRRIKSPETVKSQRRSILMKLGARNMAHAVATAVTARLIEIERAA